MIDTETDDAALALARKWMWAPSGHGVERDWKAMLQYAVETEGYGAILEALKYIALAESANSEGEGAREALNDLARRLDAVWANWRLETE